MRIPACLFVILLLAASTLAQSPGPPETLLAEINIRQSKIADVEKLYGDPESVFGAPAPYPQGTKQYKWGRLTLTLLVLTEPSTEGDKITAIQIEGQGDRKAISSTGRGLKLDDKEHEIKKIYKVTPTNPTTVLHWSTGETLTIHLDDKKHVDRMELTLSSAEK